MGALWSVLIGSLAVLWVLPIMAGFHSPHRRRYKHSIRR